METIDKYLFIILSNYLILLPFKSLNVIVKMGCRIVVFRLLNRCSQLQIS